MAAVAVLSSEELANAIAAMAVVEGLPLPSMKTYKMNVSIVNQTQFELQLVDEYFMRGRFDTGATSVPAFKSMTFAVCNKTWSAVGASGGVQFNVIMPNSGSGRQTHKFAVGFNVGPTGYYGAARFNASAYEGYLGYTWGAQATSKGFPAGKGNPFKLQVYAAAGATTRITLDQVEFEA